MTEFNNTQLAGIRHTVLHGVPLGPLATCWLTTEEHLLEIAGISREDHVLRQQLRRDAVRRGLDTDEVDRTVFQALVALEEPGLLYVAVCRNSDEECLAVMGTYKDRSTAEHVADEVRGGEKRGWRVERFNDQFTECVNHYNELI